MRAVFGFPCGLWTLVEASLGAPCKKRGDMPDAQIQCHFVRLFGLGQSRPETYVGSQADHGLSTRGQCFREQYVWCSELLERVMHERCEEVRHCGKHSR